MYFVTITTLEWINVFPGRRSVTVPSRLQSSATDWSPPEEYTQKLIIFISKLEPLNILQGLGELLDEKQKAWAKKHLVDELLFFLRSYGEKQ